MKIRYSVRLAMVCVTCLIAAPGVARADDKSDIKALVVKVENAMNTKDLKGIMATTTKDYTLTNKGKTLKREEVSAQMQQFFQGMKGNPKVKFTIVSCDVKGKAATVVSTDTMSLPSPPGPGGKSHDSVVSGKSKLGLVKSANGWLIKSELVLSEQVGTGAQPIKAQPAQAK